MKEMLFKFAISAGLMILFVVYTLAVMFIDVKPIGPQGSLVGFATINNNLHNMLGVNMQLYNITDWLGLIALFIALGFAILGAIQLIKRKSLFRVDSSIFILAGHYVAVICAYLFFEFNIINYRPILINGFLEASYPSSTTLLVLCIIPTAMLQFRTLIKRRLIKNTVNILCGAFTVFMVIGRLLSGVHWFTDILGGLLLSSALVMLYFSLNCFIDFKKLKS